MTLTALQTFLAILETGSLVRAADRLNVTQSTVTARLKGLEEQLGTPLFHRYKSGVQLTDAGAKFRRYAAAMTELWRQARQETGLPPGVESVCNLGCDADLWPGLGRALFRAIGREHPEVALTAWPGRRTDLDGWLSSGLVNVALSYEPLVREGRTTRLLGAERLVLVSTRPDAPLAHDPGYVYVDQGEAFGRSHATAYSEADTAKVSFGSALWAREHILEAGGSAYLPERLAGADIKGGRLHRVAGAPVFERSVYLTSDDAETAGWDWLPALAARCAFA